MLPRPLGFDEPQMGITGCDQVAHATPASAVAVIETPWAGSESRRSIGVPSIAAHAARRNRPAS